MRRGKKNHEFRVHFIGKTENAALCRSRQGMYAVLTKTSNPSEVTCLRCLDRVRIDLDKLKSIKERY